MESTPITIEARWGNPMPIVGSTEDLPAGTGWLRGVDADGAYRIQPQADGGLVKVAQDDESADTGPLEFRPAGQTEVPWLPHDSPEMVKLISETWPPDAG